MRSNLKQALNLRKIASASKELLEILSSSRGSGSIGKVLAGVNITARAIDLFNPKPSTIIEWMDQHDYRKADCWFIELLSDSVMEQHLVNRVNLGKESDQTISIYDNGTAITTEWNSPRIWLKKHIPLPGPIYTHLWDNHRELSLRYLPAKEDGTHRLSTLPLPPVGDFIGPPSLQDVARSFGVERGKASSLLLVGPSGVGKSTYARRLASEVMPQGRLLKVTSEVFDGHNTGSFFSQIMTYFKPDILLFDDIVSDHDYKSSSSLEEILYVLEGLHGTCLFLATIMDDRLPSKAVKPGYLYLDGMRPGRIDEIVTFPLPDEDTRKQILQHYATKYGIVIPTKKLSRMTEDTRNLTGAYIADLVRRLYNRGPDYYSDELAKIRYASSTHGPKTSNKDREAERRTLPTESTPE